MYPRFLQNGKVFSFIHKRLNAKFWRNIDTYTLPAFEEFSSKYISKKKKKN